MFKKTMKIKQWVYLIIFCFYHNISSHLQFIKKIIKFEKITHFLPYLDYEHNCFELRNSINLF